MIKPWLAWIGIVSLFLGCTSVTATEERVVSKINRSTAEIVDLDGDVKCAGVWISPDLLLTAAHCVVVDRLSAGETWYRVYEDSVRHGKVHRGQVIRLDAINDLALIVGSGGDHSWAQINLGYYPGEKLWIVGHTSGYLYSVAEGRISGVKHLTNPSDFEVKAIQVSGPVWRGNSGGGMFNADGELLGICSFVSGKGPMISFFIPMDSAIPLLEGL